ncbi:MAG TPA: YeeE/YedE thiosulfate transporter family protein [Candidatus Eisenbacteria bacterium]|nr:YeeE/YedE thiosulfate transporter family protein [Candidatus Eisenbacteria bacterium]
MVLPAVSLGVFLAEQYRKLFTRPWPVIPSALILGALNAFLFAYDRPWTASDGARNWGDWLFQTTGVIQHPDLLPPHLYSGSVLNLGVLFGGLGAALLSREFALRAAPGYELMKGALGGLMMGAGAMAAFGCNIGGFFSALSALSASGVVMMAGLALGAFAATRLTLWERTRLISAGKPLFSAACDAQPPAEAAALGWGKPLAGAALFLGFVLIAYLYQRLGYGPQAVFWSFGIAFGVIFQRSRFCLVRAFREPFLSGESEHAKAAALALVLSLVGFSILKATDLKDPMDWVFPSYWQGALLGGVAFGFGMVIAGGCGAGSIWRAGEGHLKLWFAVLFFAVGASLSRQLLVRTELLARLGGRVFLPAEIGWAGAVAGVVALMIFWYLVTGW